MKSFFTKDVCIMFSCLVIFFPVVITLLIFIIKSKGKKKSKFFYLLMFFVLLFCNIIPKENIMDMIPINRSNIEDAFNFDFNHNYKLIFKQKYKDTYFTVGKSTYNQGRFEVFGFYKNTKYGWRTLIQPSDGFTGYKEEEGYEIHYFNNKNNNVTGIFISGVGINDKLVDKYNTKFNYIKYKNNKPIIYRNQGYCIYFGIVKHNIDKDYYIKINNTKIKIK